MPGVERDGDPLPLKGPPWVRQLRGVPGSHKTVPGTPWEGPLGSLATSRGHEPPPPQLGSGMTQLPGQASQGPLRASQAPGPQAPQKHWV